MLMIHGHLPNPSASRTYWQSTMIFLSCLALMLMPLFAVEVAAGAEYQPTSYDAAIGRMLYVSEPSETALTIITQFTLGEGVPDKVTGLWLAGLKEKNESFTTALALTWTPTSKGWLGEQWSVQLQSAAGLIPTQLSPKAGVGFLTGSQFTDLVVAVPKSHHTYEATLSYNPSSGAVAVRLFDMSVDEVIANVGFNVLTSSGPLTPFAGAQIIPQGNLERDHQVVALDDLDSVPTFLPVGLSLDLVNVKDPTVTLLRIDRCEENAFRLKLPWELPGQIYLFLQDDEGTEQQLAVPEESVAVVPFSVSDMTASKLQVKLVFEYEGQRWSLLEKSWPVGTIHATLEGIHLTTIDNTKYLTGNLVFVADGTVENGTVEIDANLVVPSGVRSVTSLGTLDAAPPLYMRLADSKSSVLGHMQCNLAFTGLSVQSTTIPFRCAVPEHFMLADSESEAWVSLTASLLEPQGVHLSLSGSQHFPAGLSQTERPTYRFPLVDGYKVMVGDFHIHTTLSDGKANPKERLIEAYYDGYDVIAITDHRTVEGYDEMIDLANALGILLIRGIETGPQGEEHYVVFGIPEDYIARNPHSWASTEAESQTSGRIYYRDQLNYIKEVGGLVVYAHPHRGLREPTRWAIEQGILSGIEVFNNSVVGVPRWGAMASHGTEVYPFAFDWARENSLSVFANSDIHQFSTGPEGRAKTLFLVKEPTEAGIFDAVRARRTIALIPQPAMLWAPAELLGSYVHSIVDVSVSHVDLQYYKTCVQLENHGAFPVKARVSANGELLGEIEIGQGQNYTLWHPSKADEVQIDWLNLWINPQENFKTVHTPKDALHG